MEEKVIYFQPKNEYPMWQTIYNVMKDREIGETFSYSQLQTMCGLDVLGRKRFVIYAANKHLLNDCNKMLKNIRGFGYKLALPSEQMDHAQMRRKSGNRQYAKGLKEVTCIDKEKMTDAEIQRQTLLINHFQNSYRVLRKRSLKAAKKTEESLKSQKANISQIDNMLDELQKLKERLK